MTAVHAPAPLPPDEERRLDALRSFQLLDTASEGGYDDLAALAADICGAPMALISLVDSDRQWFKARIGTDVEQTPRDLAFCAHALLSPYEVLHVRDATLDPRFAGNPLVTGTEHLRFYAGTPLVTTDDQPVGTLCVLDTTPRELDDRQLGALRALGRQVVAQMELRRQLLTLAKAEQEVRQSEDRYRQLSLHDGLTGLPNRAQLHQRLAEVPDDEAVGVVYLDLDGFKAVNDTYGHDAGDRLLVETSRRLRSVCGAAAVPIRLGGDEFVVLQTSSGPGALADLCTALVDAVAAPQPAGSAVRSVGVSAGTAYSRRARPDGHRPDRMLSQADDAMYHHKRARRRTGKDDGPAGRTGTLHQQLELRTAIERGQVRAVYQPVWDVPAPGRVADARLVGVEALARWHHPVRGVVPPAEFITLAEQAGLIGELGASMLTCASRDVVRWEQGSPLPAGFRVHVNLASEQLHSGDLPALLDETLAAVGLDPSRLCLEVTESSLIDAHRFTPADAAALTARGVDLALDDFGTGFSSLTQLRTYPFATVKIDRSFVQDLVGSPTDRAIVRSVLDLAAALGMSAVAEGVETPGQLALLSALGCTRFQGYLLGRPLPPAAIVDLLRPSLPPPRHPAGQALVGASPRGAGRRDAQ